MTFLVASWPCFFILILIRCLSRRKARVSILACGGFFYSSRGTWFVIISPVKTRCDTDYELLYGMLEVDF